MTPKRSRIAAVVILAAVLLAVLLQTGVVGVALEAIRSAFAIITGGPVAGGRWTRASERRNGPPPVRERAVRGRRVS
jgi:hypothetical protein